MGHSAKSTAKIGVAAILAVAAYLAISAFVHADAAPIINTSVRNNSDINTAITSAAIGANVRSVTQVASSTGPVPQGTVDFGIYSNTSCSGSPMATENSVSLVGGSATTTSTYAVTASGLSFKAHYNGDVNNIATDGQCVMLNATSNNSAISTTLSSTSIQTGSSVYDTSTLSGVAGNASGTVAYTVFSNSNCSTPYGGAGTVNVTNGVVPNSPPFQFNSAGTYYWQAVYSGDMNNSKATSTCANGILTVSVQQAPVKNSPNITTTLSSSSIQTGTSVHLGSVLNGETANASGTVAYKVYTNNSCTALHATAGTKTVTNGNVPDSDNVLFSNAGTYYWQASYGGDGQNNPATSTCGAVLTVVQAGTTPPPAGAGTISGLVFNDKNKNEVRDSGEEGLAGFTINLYQGANFSGDYDPVFKTMVTDSNGNYAFASLANGTYSIEQLRKQGWKQDTDDFASVAISGGAGVGGKDFGNVQKKEKDTCTDKVGKSKKHKNDCGEGHTGSSTSTSTKPWWQNDHDNGWHWGWFKDGRKGKED